MNKSEFFIPSRLSWLITCGFSLSLPCFLCFMFPHLVGQKTPTDTDTWFHREFPLKGLKEKYSNHRHIHEHYRWERPICLYIMFDLYNQTMKYDSLNKPVLYLRATNSSSHHRGYHCVRIASFSIINDVM